MKAEPQLDFQDTTPVLYNQLELDILCWTRMELSQVATDRITEDRFHW